MDKRKVACQDIYNKAQDFVLAYNDFVLLWEEMQVDANKAVDGYSESLYVKLIGDYEKLRKANDGIFSILENNVDDNKKYVDLFTTWDLSKTEDSVREIHEYYDDAFLAEIDYIQAIIDSNKYNNKSNSEIDSLGITATNKWNIPPNTAGLDDLTAVNNVALYRCSYYFNMPLFYDNPAEQNIFVHYYRIGQ